MFENWHILAIFSHLSVLSARSNTVVHPGIIFLTTLFSGAHPKLFAYALSHAADTMDLCELNVVHSLPALFFFCVLSGSTLMVLH